VFFLFVLRFLTLSFLIKFKANLLPFLSKKSLAADGEGDNAIATRRMRASILRVALLTTM
jgi:hypothetical protein